MRPFGPGNIRAQPLRSPCSFQPASPRPGSASVLRLGHELSSFALRVAMPPRFMNPLRHSHMVVADRLRKPANRSPPTATCDAPRSVHGSGPTVAVHRANTFQMAQLPDHDRHRGTGQHAGGPDLDFKPIAFGHLHRQWTVFKAQLRSGDELWHWTSGPRFGYCIVRNRQTVALFTYHDLGK